MHNFKKAYYTIIPMIVPRVIITLNGKHTDAIIVILKFFRESTSILEYK